MKTTVGKTRATKTKSANAERGARRATKAVANKTSGKRAVSTVSAGRSKVAAQKVKDKSWGWTLFNQLVLIFAIGCIFGTYYEELICLVRNLIETGNVILVSRRGLVYGPFSPIYGIGAVGIYLIFYRTKAKWPVCLLGGALLGGMFEYGASVVQELIFGTRSWDYTGQLGSIGGRTTVPYMLVWGLLALLAARWLYPLLEKAYDRMAGRRMNRICVALAVFLVFDATISIAAMWRQAERRAGDTADNAVEEFLDEEFPDSKLQLIYDNTVYVKKDEG